MEELTNMSKDTEFGFQGFHCASNDEGARCLLIWTRAVKKFRVVTWFLDFY
jgi:hypothetical protein